jgi:hypothetical protein
LRQGEPHRFVFFTSVPRGWLCQSGLENLLRRSLFAQKLWL